MLLTVELVLLYSFSLLPFATRPRYALPLLLRTGLLHTLPARQVIVNLPDWTTFR